MNCEICNKEIKNNIKNFYGLLICEECRDNELKEIEEDSKEL